MTNFHGLLDSFINIHEAITNKTNDCKNRILSYVLPLYGKYLDAYKKNYDSEGVKEEEKRGSDYKRFEIIYDRNQWPKSTKKEESEPKKPDDIQKPLWVKINKNRFDSLIQDVYSNLNNNEFKTTVNKKAYGWKNVKTFLEKITTQKIGEENAKELYSDLITPEITELENAKGKGKNKRHKILEFLENLKLIFTGAYLHYKNVPSESEKVLQREQN